MKKYDDWISKRKRSGRKFEMVEVTESVYSLITLLDLQGFFKVLCHTRQKI